MWPTQDLCTFLRPGPFGSSCCFCGPRGSLSLTCLLYGIQQKESGNINMFFNLAQSIFTCLSQSDLFSKLSEHSEIIFFRYEHYYSVFQYLFQFDSYVRELKSKPWPECIFRDCLINLLLQFFYL